MFTKTFNLSRNIVSLQVLVDVSNSRFPLCLINLTLRRADWLICRARANLLRDKFCEFDEKRATSQNLMLKVDTRSNFRNNFLKPATNVFVARQLDHARRKTGNIDQNLQRNNVSRQVEGVCISYFNSLACAFKMHRSNGRERLYKNYMVGCPF